MHQTYAEGGKRGILACAVGKPWPKDYTNCTGTGGLRQLPRAHRDRRALSLSSEQSLSLLRVPWPLTWREQKLKARRPNKAYLFADKREIRRNTASRLPPEGLEHAPAGEIHAGNRDQEDGLHGHVVQWHDLHHLRQREGSEDQHHRQAERWLHAGDVQLQPREVDVPRAGQPWSARLRGGRVLVASGHRVWNMGH